MGRAKVRKPRRERTFPVTIPDGAIYSWVSQAMQYPAKGEPGVTHTVEFSEGYPDAPIDCLLYRTDQGQLVGILNHYRQDMPPYEKAGNINIWVHPDAQGIGIGTCLVAEADKRFGVNFDQQRFTAAGAALARRYLRGKT